MLTLLLAIGHTQASDRTDLMTALYSKDLVRIKEEIAKAKDTRTLNKYITQSSHRCTNPILYAAEHYTPALWPLIEAGADVNVKDTDGQTPLLKTKRPRLMHMLIKAGAKADAQNNATYTPLHHVKTYQAADILMKAGAQPDAKSHNELTPFVIIVMANKIGIAKRMLALQQNLVHTKTHRGLTSLHLARTKEMAQLLLDAGANPHATDPLEKIPLHYIQEHKNRGVIKALAPKSTLESYDKEGRTPLHYAAQNAKEQWRHAQALIDAGAKVSARVKGDCHPGDTPLHIAAHTGSIGVARLLLRYTRPPQPCAAAEPQVPEETKQS